MNFSPEFYMSIVINLVAIGIFIGVYKTTIHFMQQQIVDLKEEMKRYNNVLERLIKCEQSEKAIWHRLDNKDDF